jgi:hypothetical protein
MYQLLPLIEQKVAGGTVAYEYFRHKIVMERCNWDLCKTYEYE